MAKKKKTNPITPARPCLYPFLKKPDTRWDDDGVYKVSLVFDNEDDFVTKIENKAKKEFAIAKDNMKPAQAKKLVFVSPVTDEEDEDGNTTGNVKVGFKSKALFRKDGDVTFNKLKVFDAQGVLIENLPNIGNGSKLKIAFNPVGTVVKSEFYLTCWMNAVQMIELVEFNPDGSSYGFGKEEGGYAADNKSADEDFGSGDDDKTDPDDDDIEF